MGMEPITEDFWNKSQFSDPFKSRKASQGPAKSGSCHSSALDLYKDGDFRIEMCGDQTMETLLTAHHEMGHVQYYMNYHHQPPIFRVSKYYIHTVKYMQLYYCPIAPLCMGRGLRISH